LPRRKQPYGLVEVLAARGEGPLSAIIRDEGAGLAERLKDTVFHCNVDFGLIVEASRAARPVQRQSAEQRVLSQEWIALRLTLEHLVYFTSRLQVFLSAALGDEYINAQASWRSRFRFPRVRDTGKQLELSGLVRAWRRLVARQVRRRDRRAEFRLIADAALLVATANLRFSRMLVAHLRGSW
jgi:hypothetical protein